MTPTDHIIFWIASLIAAGLIFRGVTDFFSQDARASRKRRRNYRRVTTKARRPAVMLSVRTKKI